MIKISASLAVALGLIAFAGCKKKKPESTGTGSGTATATATKPPDGGVAVKPPDPPKPDQPKPNPALVARITTQYQVCIGYINAANWDAFSNDCVEDSFTGHAIAGMPEVKGKDALLAWFKDQKAAFPDWKLATQILVIDETNLFAVNLSTGTHQGPMKTPMGEIAATKKKTGLLMFHRLKLTEAGKASGEWAIIDPSTLMGQLGRAPKGAPPPRAAMAKLAGEMEMATTQFPADQANVKANLELVKKGNDAFNAHKTADMLALLADDAVESDQAGPKDYVGKTEIEKSINELFGAFSDAKLTNVQMWAASNYVVQIGKLEGTNDGDMGPMKKTGKKVALDFAEVIKLADGKISKIWRFHSGMDAAMQLGMMPAPAGGDTKKAPAK